MFSRYFLSWGAEQKIRQYLIDNNFVEAVISLAPNLFFGTSIAVNILVLAKNKTNDTRTQFIDASGFFDKATNNNILSDTHIEEIIKIFADKKDIPHVCKFVDNDIIAENDYNLSVSTYVEAKDTREKIDIKVLNEEIKTIVSKVNVLRQGIDEIITEIEGQ